MERHHCRLQYKFSQIEVIIEVFRGFILHLIHSVVFTCSARLIGLLYIIFGLLSGISAFGFSFLMRAELCGLGEQLLFGDHQFYYVTITSHAMLMIFFFIMPAVISGFSNLLLPSLLGVPEMVFPRLNNLGLLLLPFSFVCLVGSGTFDEGCGTA